MVLKTFGKLIKKGMIYRGDRPVFWSVQNQRVLAEDEITLKTEIRESLVLMLPIKKFGKKSKTIKELYPDTKMLVFCTEPWKITGMNAAALNENLLYILAKWKNEYVIV